MNTKLKLVHGEGEIKRFDSQIREAFQLFETIGPHNIFKNRQLIEDLGFRYTSSTGDTFLGKRQVIKYGYMCSPPPPPKFRVPSVIYSHTIPKSQMDWDGECYVIIQPLVKYIPLDMEEYDVITSFKSKLKEIGHPRCDVHAGNIGMYRNRPVLFDW